MADIDRLQEDVQKIVEEALASFIKDTLDELKGRISELKSRVIEEIERQESEKLREVSEAIERTVLVEDIAAATKYEADNISKRKLTELEATLDRLIRDKIAARNREFESIIEKAIKSKDTLEKLSDEIVRWLSEHSDFLSEVLEDKLKYIVTEKKEKDITRTVDDFIKAPEFKDMVKLQFMNFLATSRDVFSNIAKEVLREQIEREANRVLKDALKQADAMVKQAINERLEKELNMTIEQAVEELVELKEEFKKLKAELEELRKRATTIPQKVESEKAEEEEEEAGLEVMEENLHTLGPTHEEVIEEEEEAPSVEYMPKQESVEIEPAGPGGELTDVLTIKYYGHSSFLISNSRVKIIMDPYKKGALDGAINFEPIEDEADIVTVSHSHMDHAGWKEIPGNPQLVEAQGLKILKGVMFKGVLSYHDKSRGAVRGQNMIFVVGISGAKLAHLGDLGHPLTPEQIEKIGIVDILMVPIGGYFTIDAEEAWEVVNILKPTVVIPIHYKNYYVDLPIASLDPFLALAEPNGYEIRQFEDSVVSIRRIPENKQVWVIPPANIPKH